MKKLLEPSRFDVALTFDDAFGREVTARPAWCTAALPDAGTQGVSAQLWPAQVTRLLQSLARRSATPPSPCFCTPCLPYCLRPLVVVLNET